MLTVEVIRAGQVLGWSIKDIAARDTKHREQVNPPARAVAILRGQLEEIEAKAAELNWMRAQLRDKLDWIEQGAHGAQPGFGQYGCRVAAPVSV
ncbi:MerR family DNA-binding protein [Janthinobacterium sp. GB4P2]|uniref:MerR family DNA-binding protein n=1 Tax=Janthinobacterium sp. GB4P2 TaxID=3424189 RepID=UPI003F212DFE